MPQCVSNPVSSVLLYVAAPLYVRPSKCRSIPDVDLQFSSEQLKLAIMTLKGEL